MSLNETAWMLHPTWCDLVVGTIPSGPRERIARKYQRMGAIDFSPEVDFDDGIAVVRVDGALTRRPSFWQAILDGLSSELLASTIEELSVRDDVGAIVLRVDSPGGEASGMPEVAESVRQAAMLKPVIAVADRMMASGAYYLASQATAIYAGGRDADVGSIGTVLLAYDYSEALANAGVKPVVISTGPFKATGAMGTEITEEQREYLQALVDETQRQFAAAVQSGRKLTDEQLKQATDGRVFMPAEALKLGLIDGVKSFSEVMAETKAQYGRPQKRGARQMSQSNESQPATYQELKAEFPNATPEFLCQCQDKGLTLADAKQTRIATLESGLEAALQENRELVEKNEQLEQRLAKLAAVGVTTDLGEEPQETRVDPAEANQRWRAEVERHTQLCGGDRLRGFRAAYKAHPELAQLARQAG